MEQVDLKKSLQEKTTAYDVVKRGIDFTFSFLGLVILFPILLIVALLIKFDSKGPIFFKQERVGLMGEKFYMYKFRSMVINAEKLKDKLQKENEMSGPMFKMKKDPRITRVGRFIRKTSIDELPQLFNVIKGEMSLVGPRPSLPKEVDKFEPWMLKRLEVKPGLTCYWQVSGRNSIGFEEWMRLDCKYVNDRSTWLDLKLIFRTFFVLFGDEDAC